MAGQVGPLSLTQIQKLGQEQSTLSISLCNAHHAYDDGNDDSWEVRAFAEDTANILGATWPPRSYTCTFCRREFRSAQALGGHMNVHRRDRARLQQFQSGATIDPPSPSLLLPNHEFFASSGLCVLYPLPAAGTVFTPTSTRGAEVFLDFPSPTLISLSPYPLSPCSPSSAFPVVGASEAATPVDQKSNSNDDDDEELDLELRLGQRPLN